MQATFSRLVVMGASATQTIYQSPLPKLCWSLLGPAAAQNTDGRALENDCAVCRSDRASGGSRPTGVDYRAI